VVISFFGGFHALTHDPQPRRVFATTTTIVRNSHYAESADFVLVLPALQPALGIHRTLIHPPVVVDSLLSRSPFVTTQRFHPKQQRLDVLQVKRA
jgi:hypothetical protein